VFKGTRVPVKTLFDYVENNYTLDEFLECFPSVTREMTRSVLERSEARRPRTLRSATEERAIDAPSSTPTVPA